MRYSLGLAALILTLAVGAAPAQAVDNQFTGATNGDWNTATNWSQGHVPLATEDVKIDVDSIEERILAGAQETLGDPDLRSVLIELEAAETARNYRLTDALKSAGLYLAQRNASSQGDVVNGIFVRRTVPAAAEPFAGRRQA